MPVSGPQQEDNQAALEERDDDGATAVDDSVPGDGGARGRADTDGGVGDPADAGAGGDAGVEAGERRAKMERLRAEGIEPYPPVTLWADRTRIADVLAAHDPSALAQGDHPELRYHVAGRLTSRRGHGKTAFLDVRDLSGSIQAVVRFDALGEEAYERILNLDVGDIVGIVGSVYVTQRGQLALAIVECTLLTKSLRPPPDKHHGLGDTGTRYRYRELDLLANEDTRDLFLKRDRKSTRLNSSH